MRVPKAFLSHREHGDGRQMSQQNNHARNEWLRFSVALKKEHMFLWTNRDFAWPADHERLVTGLIQIMFHRMPGNGSKVSLYHLWTAYFMSFEDCWP